MHRITRPGDIAVTVIGLLSAVFLLLMLVRPGVDHRNAAYEAALRTGMADPVITTAARYLRHASLADPMTPFMDAPASLEHFPAGGLVPPPAHFGDHQ